MYFDEQKTRAHRQYRMKLRMYTWAEKAIEQFQLQPFVEKADHIYVANRNTGDHWVSPMGYFSEYGLPDKESYRLTICIPYEYLDELRPHIVRADGPDWTKMQWVHRNYSAPYDLPQKYFLYQDYDYYFEENRQDHVVHLRFLRPVEEGETIDGCKVQRTSTKTIEGDLVLACEKK